MADPSLLFSFSDFNLKLLYLLRDNQDQGRDGQPLADHLLLRPEVDLFPPQRANLLSGISSLNTTVDGISSRLDQLSKQVTSLHRQVNFQHDTRNVEINLDPNSIRNHLRDSIGNWSSRKTELYFESESLLKILESMIINNYSGRALSHVLVRAREFLLHLGHHGPLSKDLRMLLNYRVLLSLLIALELSLRISHIAKVQLTKDSFEGKGLSNIPSHLKNLLNRNLSLFNDEVQSFLNCSKNIDALRNTKFVGESTSNSCVSVKREVLLFDPETDDIVRNLDVKKIIQTSPSQGSSINHLFAQELEESNSPLSDVSNAVSAQKKSIIDDSKQKFYFTADILKQSVLKELGLKPDDLNLFVEGLKVNFKKDLDFSKLKRKPNNRNINRNKSIVRNYLNSLEESGSCRLWHGSRVVILKIEKSQ